MYSNHGSSALNFDSNDALSKIELQSMIEKKFVVWDYFHFGRQKLIKMFFEKYSCSNQMKKKSPSFKRERKEMEKNIVSFCLGNPTPTGNGRGELQLSLERLLLKIS